MRADRLISLILILHARGRSTAQALSAQLEVSERTVYRDIDALSAAGIPVYTQTGLNGGIFLDEDYRLALTGLSTPEVRALFVSSGSGPLHDLGLASAAEHTLLKMMAALPGIHRSEAQRMRQRFHIDPKNWFQIAELPPFLPLLQQAVWEDRIITADYQPVEGTTGARTLEAHALVAKANLWYLVGRKPGGQLRNFRLSRFENVALTGQRFERDAQFDLAAYWDAARARFEAASEIFNPSYTALLRVSDDFMWYFMGYMNGRFEILSVAQGRTTIRVNFDSLFDARMRVLGLGTAADVIEPEELSDAVLETARGIVMAAAKQRP